MKSSGGKKKSYKELIKIPTFDDRFKYLKDGTQAVGEKTFGHSRYVNQEFYQSPEWKEVRRKVILRDNACDLGLDGHQIDKGALVHHINPITLDDILNRDPKVLDMDNLICVSRRTHNAIHFADESLVIYNPVERTPNDTCPWKTISAQGTARAKV